MNKLEYPALGETVYEETLPNGLKVIVARKPGFQRSYAMFAARYGGADRRFRHRGEWIDTPAGVAHFLEHKMFDMPDGTNVLGLFSARGAAPNAFTGAGMTAYHFTCTQGFEDNLRTLLTYVSTPYYTDESVAKEQGIIGQEIRMYENNPASACFYGMMGALYAHHPVRETVAGTVESIAEITPEILYSCHRVFYHPSNMALCCVGDVDPRFVADTAAELLSGEPGDVPERDYGPAEDLLPARERTEKATAVAAPLFYIGAKLPPEKDGRAGLRQQLVAELALEYLAGQSSGLYTELYAKGLLNRDFGTGVDTAAGTATAILAGESPDPEAVMAALTERVDRIARKGVDAGAFERCRRARYGAELSGLDQFGGYARSLVQGAFEGWRPAELFDLLTELTGEEAADFLCETITPRRLAMSVVRPGQ